MVWEVIHSKNYSNFTEKVIEMTLIGLISILIDHRVVICARKFLKNIQFRDNLSAINRHCSFSSRMIAASAPVSACDYDLHSRAIKKTSHDGIIWLQKCKLKPIN